MPVAYASGSYEPNRVTDHPIYLFGKIRKICAGGNLSLPMTIMACWRARSRGGSR